MEFCLSGGGHLTFHLIEFTAMRKRHTEWYDRTQSSRGRGSHDMTAGHQEERRVLYAGARRLRLILRTPNQPRSCDTGSAEQTAAMKSQEQERLDHQRIQGYIGICTV